MKQLVLHRVGWSGDLHGDLPHHGPYSFHHFNHYARRSRGAVDFQILHRHGGVGISFSP
jgi:hypothetical protein